MQIELTERIADLVHTQWSHWTEHMLNNLTEKNIKRWKRQMKTEYNHLSEKEKDSDRKFAKEYIKLLKEYKLLKK